MLPKVSIITATYNSAATVKDTLESVAKQTYTNIEHIIVDGLSTDETIAIAKQYNVKIICEKDKGLYDAMNKGIFHATGDIIAILNSDDFYTENNIIEKVVSLLKNEEADGLYADLIYVDANNTNKIKRNWKSGLVKKNSFYYGWMPPHPTLFVKKKIYEKCGNFNLDLKSAADYEFMLRAFVKHKFNFVYLPEVIVKMRDGGISNVNLKNRLKANNEDRKSWKINSLKPYFFTLYLKPLRKIFQFINK